MQSRSTQRPVSPFPITEMRKPSPSFENLPSPQLIRTRNQVRNSSTSMYDPQRYLATYELPAVGEELFPTYHCRMMTAEILADFASSDTASCVQNLRVYLISHDRAPIPVFYLLSDGGINIYTRSGVLLERSESYAKNNP